MIFSPDMLAKVLDGTKTQTRRPVKAWEFAGYWPRGFVDGRSVKAVFISAGNDVSRKKWAVGDTVAVRPGRGKKSVGHISITDMRIERPCDISEADARAEGFDTREAFWDKLRALYGDKVNLTAPYWALTFELVGGAK